MGPVKTDHHSGSANLNARFMIGDRCAKFHTVTGRDENSYANVIIAS